MSLGVEMPSPNALVGLVGDITRIATMTSIKRNDTLLKVWRKVVAPVMTETFLKGVLSSPSFMTFFKFSLPEDLSSLNDFQWNALTHVAAFQHLGQIADRNVALNYVPWQIRFEFDRKVHDSMLTVDDSILKELTDGFSKYGWHFWLTATGFCIAPLSLFENLKSLTGTYNAWLKLDDFKGAGFQNFPVEEEEQPIMSKAQVQALAQEQRLAAAGPMPPLETVVEGVSAMQIQPSNVSNAAAGSLMSAASSIFGRRA
jgi:hypothetical protein